MKKMFTLLLTLAMVIASFTGCGCTASPNNTTDDNATGNAGTSAENNMSDSQNDTSSEFQDGGSDSTNGNSNTGNAGDMGNSADTAPDNGHSILDDAGNAIDNGMNDAENALNGSDTTARNRAGGVSYEKMLRNARVHDKDGNLNDQENSVSTPLF